MPNQPDTVYGRRPWNDRPQDAIEESQEDTRYDYLGPHSSRDEAVISQALASTTTPGEYLADIVRPPLTQVQLFRQRYGYRSRQLGIADIMDVDKIYAEPRTEMGGAATPQGTSRNSLGNASY